MAQWPTAHPRPRGSYSDTKGSCASVAGAPPPRRVISPSPAPSARLRLPAFYSKTSTPPPPQPPARRCFVEHLTRFKGNPGSSDDAELTEATKSTMEEIRVLFKTFIQSSPPEASMYGDAPECTFILAVWRDSILMTIPPAAWHCPRSECPCPRAAT
ncbi:hypothetical protein U9M48_043757, partial [Paspalum notatum var. saurae]